MAKRLLGPLRTDRGFGLVELLIAMVVLNVGLLAVVAVFVNGSFTIWRASRIATATSLADQQMELYRALTYGAIALDSASVDATDSVYRDDSALGGSIANDVTTTTGCTGLPNQCNPSRSVTGPDHGGYRVDTYVTWRTPTSGRQVKLVTVVVRDATKLTGLALTRQASSFDESTGS